MLLLLVLLWPVILPLPCMVVTSFLSELASGPQGSPWTAAATLALAHQWQQRPSGVAIRGVQGRQPP
jgi:hypothetical protein